jgi:hypothetical protein
LLSDYGFSITVNERLICPKIREEKKQKSLSR